MKKDNGKMRVTVSLDYSVYDKLISAYSDFLLQNDYYISFIAFIAKKISEAVAE